MLGNVLKELRQAHGLNQFDIARELEVSKQTVSNWENKHIVPSIYMLKRLADYFQVSTDYLLGRDDKTYIEVSKLSPKELAHVRQIISDIAEQKDHY